MSLVRPYGYGLPPRRPLVEPDGWWDDSAVIEEARRATPIYSLTGFGRELSSAQGAIEDVGDALARLAPLRA